MYYNLSKNVYRFAAGPSEGSDGVVCPHFLLSLSSASRLADHRSIPSMSDLASKGSTRSSTGSTPSFKTRMPIPVPSRIQQHCSRVAASIQVRYLECMNPSVHVQLDLFSMDHKYSNPSSLPVHPRPDRPKLHWHIRPGYCRKSIVEHRSTSRSLPGQS